MADPTLDEDLDDVVDLQTDKRDRVLFYLAGRVPVSPTDLAAQVVQPTESIRSVLEDRFENAVDIDATGFIRLTDAARTPVLRVGKTQLETATESMSAGKQLHQDGDFEAAAAEFETAADIAHAIKSRFDAVNYQPDQLDEFIVAAEQRHDDAQKEATKDTLNALLLKAQQHESKGDEQDDSDRLSARTAYYRARDELTDAIESIEAYNEGRLSESSSRLNPDEFRSRLKRVLQKLVAVTPSSSDNASPPTESTDPSKSELLDVLRTANEERERLPLPSDFQSGRDYTPDQYRDRFGSWDAALEAAGIDKRTYLEDELRRLSADGNNAVSRKRMADDGRYSATFVADEYGSWDAALTAAGLKSAPGSGSPIADTDNDTGQAETNRSTADRSLDEHSPDDETERTYSELNETAFSSSWETIPHNERLSGQFLFCVVRVQPPRGDKKTHVLEVEDRTGTELSVDIWKTHDLSYEWTEGHWYAVSNARGSAWETKSGETKKRLSSTKDLEVESLGPDFDPIAAAPGDTNSTSTTSSTNSTTSQSQSAESTSSPEAADTSQSDDEIFDDIVSEFDDL
ncbi:homing endonuclease associated repeat-containing protein [Halarchaeum salinum]|uniref:Helix-turn-helix domain-containing protein n=1 Tax=Halarchaeum salinum TaxID=489912 RepID=A0AAV3S2H0_9EURY